MKKKVSGKTIFNISVIVLSFGMLGYFCLHEKGGIDNLVKDLRKLDYGWIVMAFLSNLINIFIDGFLIYRFTSNSLSSYRYRDAFKSSMVGQFFSAITPFATGGQPMQIYLMSKQGVSPGISTAALIQRFLVYQTSITAYSALAILVQMNYFKETLSPVMWGFALFGFASQGFVILMLLLFSFNRRLTHGLLKLAFTLLAKLHIIKNPEERIEGLESQLSNFHESNKELFRNRRLLVESYVLTAVQLTAMFIIPYCVYRSFHLYGAPVTDMVCSQAFVTMASCFIPLPGAAGASELSFAGFFRNFFPEESLTSAMLVWRIITYYAVILFTAPFSRLAKQKDAVSSAQ
jgi:uncharacterized protein (TIRG00374 family)